MSKTDILKTTVSSLTHMGLLIKPCQFENMSPSLLNLLFNILVIISIFYIKVFLTQSIVQKSYLNKSLVLALILHLLQWFLLTINLHRYVFIRLTKIVHTLGRNFGNTTALNKKHI